MPSLPDLSNRRLEPELMDDPALDSEAHRRALLALARVNRLSRVTATLWPAIADLVEELEGRPLTLLDLACGGGDVARALAGRARRGGVRLEVEGCDISPTAIELARRQAERAGAEIVFFEHDAVADDLPRRYDVIVSTLFLHHLAHNDAATLLKKIERARPRLILISDLERDLLGYALSWIGPRLVTRSPVARHDGPPSVRAAWTRAEALALAERAGLAGARVRRVWPRRFVLSWKPAD